MTDDVAKVADKLNENMAHAVMHAYKGGIHCDHSKATQKALVKRGLAQWDSDHEDGADLTPLGLEVQTYLKQRAATASEAKVRERAEVYELGRRMGQSTCVSDLYSAVYPGDPWPDRPLDTIWENLLERVRFQQGDEDEPGACGSALCGRPAGPHGMCRGHSCGDEVPEAGIICRLPKGHGGHWHDSGSQCWLVADDFDGPDPGADADIFQEVVAFVLSKRWSAVSTVQRKLRLGFAKAGRMVALMEDWGLVGPPMGSHARDILAPADMLDEVLAAIRAKSGQDAANAATSAASKEGS